MSSFGEDIMGLLQRGIALAMDTAAGRRSPVQAVNLIKYRLSRPALVLPYSPLVLCVFPTDRCNLRCKMCLTHAPSPQGEGNPFRHFPAPDMPLEMFKEAADLFRTATSVQMVGTGEPLLNKDYFRMVEYASRVRKMDVVSTCNGTLMHMYTGEIAASPLKEMNISLNSHCAEDYERLTGHGAEIHQKICENIQLLVNEKRRTGSSLKITVSYILDVFNYKYAQEMLDFAHRLGVDAVFLYNYMSTVDTPGLSAKDRCLYEDNADVREVLSRLRLPGKLELAPFCFLKRQPARSCRLHFTHIIVDGNGNIGCCGKMVQDFRQNGRFTDPDVWNNDFIKQMRRRFLDPQVPLLGPCRNCDNNM